jgi:hypothetical protein
VDANLAGDVDKRKVLLDLCILWVIQLCVGFKVAIRQAEYIDLI